jgi:hypothetical protein
MSKRINTLLITLVFVLIVTSAIAATYAKPSKQLIVVSFLAPFPPNAMSQIDKCTAKIFWVNSDLTTSHNGAFLFTANTKGTKLVSSDVMFTYNGATISGIQSGNSLLFFLPDQTFEAGKSGLVSADVVYEKAGEYNWQIGIIQR